ncbi:hypothetical protein SNE40_017111 [Patella caerulea]|uniref:Tetratricopeptide repeat protein 12 n=1 Tax=Patella caerulea TaxID=87958 RepID=A0AAN8JEG6_PATCE
MGSAKEVKEVDKFLSKVDEIESIIKGLNAKDETDQQDASHRADNYLQKHQKKKQEKEERGFNRTVINTLPSVQAPPGPAGLADNIDQAGFMAVMERDAQERAERRQVNQKEADRLKLLGNTEFKNGNYEKALDYYNQAMEKIRDNQAIYTNRAQTKIKLGMYTEAITDCDWALRISSDCLKAHVHMGKAYLGLKNFIKARECFQQILTVDPKKSKMVEDYLADVDHEEMKEQQTEKVKELFESGNKEITNLVELLDKINKPDQLPLYYSGGFRVISSIMTNENDKSIFRSQGGIDLINKHPTLHRCLTASPLSLNREELDVLDAAINMYIVACTDNDFNKEEIMKSTVFTDGVTQFLQAKVKGQSQGHIIKSLCIQLLHVLSTSKMSRSLIVTRFDLSRLLTSIFHQIKTNTLTAKISAALLNNLALDNKFKTAIRDTIDDQVLPSFESLVKDNSCQQCVLPTCLSFMTNLTADDVIRKKLSNRTHLWETCLQIFETHKTNLTDAICVEILSACVGLLCNLSKGDSSELVKFSQPICQHCLTYVQTEELNSTLRVYSLKLLSHILPKSPDAVNWLCDRDAPSLFMKFIKGDDNDMIKTSIKCLTACTQINGKAQQYVVQQKGLGHLAKLLNHEDELVKGNTALCLCHCLQVDKAGAALAKTDIVKDLLVLARDGNNSDVRQNCAILLGKLAQSDQRHLERLRELHGIEILNDCMKFIK